MKNFGDIIKFHRKKAGLSQKDLADIAGVGKTVVFDMEKEKETVQLKSLLNILQALNIRIVLESPLMDKYMEENENS